MENENLFNCHPKFINHNHFAEMQFHEQPNKIDEPFNILIIENNSPNHLKARNRKKIV